VSTNPSSVCTNTRCSRSYGQGGFAAEKLVPLRFSVSHGTAVYTSTKEK
jgi:hypothetical protein